MTLFAEAERDPFCKNKYAIIRAAAEPGGSAQRIGF